MRKNNYYLISHFMGQISQIPALYVNTGALNPFNHYISGKNELDKNIIF